jgi:TrmH family RNA methyltransferase
MDAQNLRGQKVYLSSRKQCVVKTEAITALAAAQVMHLKPVDLGANQLESPQRLAVLLEMPVRIVQSRNNARLKELRRALTRVGRDGGPAAIEGPHLVEEAFRAGLRVATVFVAEDAQHLLDGIPLGPETEVLLVPPELIRSLLSTETPQPIAALLDPFAWTWRDLLEDRHEFPPLLMVLAGIQDPGNMGTILRSAEAFGATGVISLPGTVSSWNPKAVRASAGSVLRLPLIAAGVDECFARLREAGVQVLTTVLCGGVPADSADLGGPVAFIMGNEGNGVPEEIAVQADAAVTIPCPGPVESLNASVAAGVLLYEASRQRRISARATKEPA